MTTTEATQGSLLARRLGLLDLVFLSFGGQAALLSLLTYATGAISYTRGFAPVVIVIGTLLVLFNAAVVYGLSKRYGEAGGYYIYAFYSLTRRLGLETGWLYILYSTMYGSAYILGAAYVLFYVLHVSPLAAAALIFVPAAIFLVLGIRPSAKYAEIASIVELMVLVYITLINLAIAGFHFYNPFSQSESSIPLSMLAAGILFAIGIPTGYGSITPLGGEALKKEDIGKAALIVVVAGGILAALVVYSINDASIMRGQANFILAARIPVIDFMRKFYGDIYAVPLIFAAFNDGILAPLSFMAATSRTIYAMARNEMLPRSLAIIRWGHPFNSVLTTAVLYAAVTFPALLVYDKPFALFLVYGSLAGLANLFVHLSADFSYILEGVRSLKRAAVFSSLRATRWIARKVGDIIIGVVATLISLWATSISFLSKNLQLQVDLFVMWIIVGFIYAEVLEELKAISRPDSKEVA